MWPIDQLYIELGVYCSWLYSMHFWWNNITFDQQYLNKGLKTPNLENLSLDLIFIDNFCQNIKKIFQTNLHIENSLKNF